MKVSKNLFYLLIILASAFLIILTYKQIRFGTIGKITSSSKEGFTQKSPYILKRNEKIYDKFYSQIYNDIFYLNKRTRYQVDAIVDSTLPTTTDSVFLDIGCATGETVKELLSRKYRAYGIDRSYSMITTAGKSCKSCMKRDDDGERFIKEGDVLDPMCYDSNIFTHVLCLNGKIYEIQNKPQFFKNVYNWLMRSGYFILQIASRKSVTQATPRSLEFRGMEYKSTYSLIPTSSTQVLMKETITDKESGNVRENERILYMEDMNILVDIVKKIGFNVHAIIDMKPIKDDKYQYIYIFEKI